MNVIQEIATWAKKLPPWQSDALRRIFTTDNLSASDEDEVFAMLLAAHNVPCEEKPSQDSVPFSDVVHELASAPRKVILRELHSVRGVNALVPDQCIKFALEGLTVIYGENGVGKSGYARVLKHACHAREKGEAILPNVNNQKKEKAIAMIELSVDAEEVAVQWRAGNPPSDILSEIAVFDSHCARVFIDEANEAVYLPYGLDVFGKLAALSKSLKDKIAARMALIPQRPVFIDEFTKTTSAGVFVSALTATTDIARLETLARLDDTEVRRLQELRSILATAKANPPKQRAAQLRRAKNRIEQIAAKANVVADSLSQKTLDSLKALKNAAITAAKVADIASTQAFANDPLPATGSDPWRALFEAAKAFSEKAAYPADEFPVTKDGAVCVLCQQPLAELAAQRFQRFQQFILEDAAKKKDDADTALQLAVKALSIIDVAYLASDVTLIEELRAHDEALATKVEQFFSEASQRKAAALLAAASGKWDALPDMSEPPTASLNLLIARIEASARRSSTKPISRRNCEFQENLRNLMTVSGWENTSMKSKRTLDTR